MTARTKQVLLALLFWLVFSIGAVLTILCQFFGIFKYLLTGSESERAWVFKTGQGTDALNNAAWFDGDQRETISSHCGRWVVSGQPLPLRVKFVVALTNLFEQDHCLKAVEYPFVGKEL